CRGVDARKPNILVISDLVSLLCLHSQRQDQCLSLIILMSKRGTSGLRYAPWQLAAHVRRLAWRTMAALPRGLIPTNSRRGRGRRPGRDRRRDQGAKRGRGAGY